MGSYRRPIYLQGVSVVRWGQCKKYVVKLVWGLLVFVILLAQKTSSNIPSVKKKWKVSPAATVCTFHSIFNLWSLFCASPIAKELWCGKVSDVTIWYHQLALIGSSSQILFDAHFSQIWTRHVVWFAVLCWHDCLNLKKKNMQGFRMSCSGLLA